MRFSDAPNTIRYCERVGLVVLSLSILQCKPEAAQKPVARPPSATQITTTPAACPPPPDTSEVNDAFGFVDTTPIDAAQIRIENPKALIIEDAEEQRSVLIKVDPIDLADESIYPDYALINVLDADNKPCIRQDEFARETGASLMKEFMIDSQCGGLLTIEAQGCATTSRRLDPAVKCGNKETFTFSYDASPSSEMGDVKKEIEDVRNRLSLLPKWLALKANEFLKAVPELPQDAHPDKALLYNFAKVAVADQTAFSDIFSTDAYTLLLEELDEVKAEYQYQEGAGLAAGTMGACRPVPTIASQTPENSVSPTTVDTDAVLQKAKEEHGADENSQGDSLTSSVAPPKSSDPVTAGDEKTPEKVETENISIQRAGGFALLGVSALWAMRLAYKQLYKRPKQKRSFMEDQFRKAVGKNFSEVFPEGNVKKLAWVETDGGALKVFTYEGQLIKANSDGSFTKVDPKTGAGVELQRKIQTYGKRTFTGLEEAPRKSGVPDETSFRAKAGGDTFVAQKGSTGRIAADTSYKQTGSGRLRTGVQIAAILGMAVMGGVLAGGAFGLTESDDPYAVLFQKIQKAASTRQELQVYLVDLEKRRSAITVNSISE